ncbi:hypothetical protein K440DRAFT_658393 [Wilcoxina mikolae CBS 423.85]|nr:hypothetical protein K440DRAFT_658393 [Wilcoxina mikolae CBS 423.85]
MVQSGNTDSAISVLCRLAHVAETALSTAEIKCIEDIRKRYAGKKAARSDRRVVSTARVITGKDLIMLRDQREQKDRLAAEKRAKKVTENAVKHMAKNAKSDKSPGRNHRGKAITAAAKKQVTIIVPSDHDSGSEISFESVEEGTSDSNSDDLFPTITTGRTQHPPVPVLLNTPSNPNRRLPNRPLAMSLRTRQRKEGDNCAVTEVERG